MFWIECHYDVYSYGNVFPHWGFTLCMCVGVERHLGVISLLVRGLHLRQLKEDSLWGTVAPLWGWKIWGTYILATILSALWVEQRRFVFILLCPCCFRRGDNELKHIEHFTRCYKWWLLFKLCLCNPPLTVGCCSGDKPGHHQSARERTEEALASLPRGPGPVQIRRLSGRHLWGHPASCCVSYLWR